MKFVLNHLTENNQTITFAESMTGGRLSYELVKFQGASKVFKEGFILYSDEAKVRTLEIDQKEIDEHGVVSHHIASLMATQLHKITGADFAVAITGYASGKDNNMAYVAIINDGKLYVDDIVFYPENSREQNIKTTVRKVIKMLHEIIKK
ncbi:MAG: CinA family protein [Acholeplasma sp.]